ncbi:hypothetical protein N7516_009705 [Penicillium verrucosum]|uniref:uncharacterized protein n=1 Tax=Penicillium verrucosum TaxID=60171 RepID=UPI0025458418|nr:uncharacterized protein N7516_009705 [Penicillium verrucosum]KAJ5922002.1 hypothetical protein N7516_009705 [Penicillium verrucosum]
MQSWSRCIKRYDQTRDFVYPDFLEALHSRPVRVALIYGDADYSCNWFDGEAVSLATEYEYSKEFRSAGYTPFVVDGEEYGVTRESDKMMMYFNT